MEKETKVGKVVFKRREQAVDVAIPAGIEDVRFVCYTPSFDKFIIPGPNKRTNTLNDFLDKSSSEEMLEKVNFAIIKREINVFSPKPQGDIKFDDDSKKHYLEYLDFTKDLTDPLVEDDLREYVNEADFGTKTNKVIEKLLFEKGRIIDSYNKKVLSMTRSLRYKKLIKGLRDKWELANGEENFNKLLEPSCEVVCIENWEIESKDFLADLTKFMSIAGSSINAATDYYLCLCLLIFYDFLDIDYAGAIFIPHQPQLLVKETGNTKRLFLEILPETNANGIGKIFNVLAEIRDKMFQETELDLKKAEDDYPIEWVEHWYVLHNGSLNKSWPAIARLYNLSYKEWQREIGNLAPPELHKDWVRLAVDRLNKKIQGESQHLQD